MFKSSQSNFDRSKKRKTKILIVDDEESIRTIFQLALEEYDVKIAKNGKEAIEIADQWHPHLIIMDIKMPIMDGIEATKKIKEKDTKTKILGISAFGGESENRMRKLGITEFVRKPIRISSLRKIISNITEDEN